jgi:integrase/recombinase XerC
MPTRQRSPQPSPAAVPARARRFPAEVLTNEEVLLLMHACGTRWTGVRDRALIATMYRAGLRVGEALALRPIDVAVRASCIRVLHGKGGRSRTVGIDAAALDVLANWIEVRRAMGFGEGTAIFCTKEGGPLARSWPRVLLPRLARHAGLVRRVHAHGLRHTHAAQLREEGLDLGIISKQLGHASIETTARYLDHIAPLAVVEAIRTRGWSI